MSYKTLVAGIAGGSASGKTTLAAALLQFLQQNRPDLAIETMAMDKYFYRGAPGGPRFISPSTGEDLPNNNHLNSADNTLLLQDLQAKLTAQNPPSIILLEGHMLLAVPDIRERIDLKIFVELEDDLRALRRLLRDMQGSRGSTDPHWIATYYRECARVGHTAYIEPSRVYADLIVRGDSDFARTAPLLAGALLAALHETLPKQIS